MGKKNTCEKYGLAITNYVLGEEMPISKEELIDHLRQCKRCSEDIKDWEATYAVMRAKEYDSRPEVKAKMEAFIKELTTPSLPGKQPMDARWDVGSAAGKIYDCLKTTGKIPRQTLREKTGLINYPFYEAIGWLIREEKIMMNEDNFAVYITLAEK